MKKLAIILPTYNAALYIKESVDSILNQTFKDFDLYIYDDFSTDNTAAIISEYDDSRIFYKINAKNLGIAKTLNRGLKELLPHYKYIARMDADDYSCPERFEKQLYFLEHNDDYILCGTQGYWLKDMFGSTKNGWIYPLNNDYIRYYLLFAASFGHSSILLRSTSFLNNNLKYDENISTCEDWDLWIRVQNYGKIANLPEFLMKYRILDNSNHRSSLKIAMHHQERANILSKYWDTFGVQFSTEQILEYFYQIHDIDKKNFVKKLKYLIKGLNAIYAHSKINLNQQDNQLFSYLLSRKLLDFWKRAKANRYSFTIWFTILNEVKFATKLKLIKSIIK